METKSLHFDKTIENWDEAIMLGNGDIGCLIWNTSNKLRFSIDKSGIWDCSNSPQNQENFTYADLQNLIRKKKQKNIEKKYDDCYNNPTPTKLPTGKIILDLGISENVVSSLDFMTAEGTIRAGNVEVKSFIHAMDNYGLIEISSEDISYIVDNPTYGNKKKPWYKRLSKGITQSLENLDYPDATFVKETIDNIEYQYFIQPTHDCYYGIVSAMKQERGQSLIAYTVFISEQNDFVEQGKSIVKKALQKGYGKAFCEHKKWWQSYWEKSSITLPDKALEKQWYLNNYLLGSGSRKHHFPMPLQGVWTADNGQLPPWKGDYHHDLNTQMTYTSYLKANHLEQGECFIDYLLDRAQAGRDFAKNFYGVDGLCLPSVMDIKGQALGGWSQYALSPTNQLWLCQIMSRYYFYTKDKSYLKKIYDYNSEVGIFLMHMLTLKDEYYKLPLSTSPEINDNKLSAWLTPNTNYDLALMQAFMQDMAKLSHEIGAYENEKLWEERASHLEPLAVNSEHVLMISPDKTPTESHRHHSHCMSIYPLKTLKYTDKANRTIIDATIQKLESLGIKHWVGYSVGWMAELYIAQGNGDKAVEQLHNFFNYNCTKNGFHINGDYLQKTDFDLKYRLFTLEGNFIATDAIQDMLLYSENGRIKLFPAIPKTWKNVEFHHFRGYDGILVSAKLENGILSYLEITTAADCKVNILNDISHLHTNGINPSNISLKANETIQFTSTHVDSNSSPLTKEEMTSSLI